MAQEENSGENKNSPQEQQPQSPEQPSNAAGDGAQQFSEAAAQQPDPGDNPSTSTTEDAAGELLPQLEQRIAQLEEDKLRLAAEAQNALRRSEQEVEKARKFALEAFAKDLLPVVDNLERALQSGTGSEATQAVLEGVELTLKTFQETLTRYRIEAIDPQGEPFDPQEHQAMSIQENGDVEPNTVLTVFQKGYRLNGRLVRPAMVVVSKNPA